MPTYQDDLHDRAPCVLEPLEPRLLLSVAGLSDTFGQILVGDSSAGYLSSAPAEWTYTEDAPLGMLAPASKVLDNVPEYFWYRGGGPTAEAMVIGICWRTRTTSSATPARRRPP